MNNAAEQHEVESLTELTEKQLERTFRTNIFSFFFMAKHALKHMKKGASIINTASITAYRGHKTLLDYSATKGAIVTFTRSLSESLVEKGIRVNAVAPGPIWTPLIPASFKPKKVAKHGSSAPMERAGQPNEVAPCYVFLASDDASYMTGQVLHPNGGTWSTAIPPAASGSPPADRCRRCWRSCTSSRRCRSWRPAATRCSSPRALLAAA